MRREEVKMRFQQDKGNSGVLKIKQTIFECVADLYLTKKPRQEIGDTLLKCLEELDKYEKREEIKKRLGM